MFQAIGDDQAPGTPPKPGKAAPTVPVTVPPGNVRVAVFNGSGVNGLGRKAASDIGAIGFQTIGIPQTRGTGATQTVILYGPTKADSARTLQAAIPGSVLQPDPSLASTVQLVVGTSYKGAQRVNVTAPKPGKPVSAPAVQTAQDHPCTT